MRVSPQDLSNSLKKGLEPVYTLVGEESLQIQELVDQIYNKAKSEDYLEKTNYIISKQTDWTFLKSSSENYDLFGAKKIIEIKLIGSGPGAAGSKALKDYAINPDPSKILIVSAEGLERKTHSSAWIKALEAAGCLLLINPITLNQLPRWIVETGKKYQLNIASQASSLLAEKTEGNLLATLQEIKKLALLFPDQDIDISQMASSISDSSKYNIFDLSNAFISGNKERTASVLESLKAEGTPETLILWSLSRELTNLFKVINQKSAKGIWGPRQYLNNLEELAKKVALSDLKHALQQVAKIDASIKGSGHQDPWQAIRELTITF